MNIQSSKHILLTGAGFTKYFGALLASEMWAAIFNHKKIQAQPKIKEIMMDDFDYESIYYSIMEGSYTNYEKEAIDEAVKSAYEYIDSIIINYTPRIGNGFYPTEYNNVLNLIERFAPTSNTITKSFIFTLNQDLFFERLYFGIKLYIPGINNDSRWFEPDYREKLESLDYCQLPNVNEVNIFKQRILSDGNFFVIKLHGSYNWKSYDSSQKMVIGRGKTEQIMKEPLLNYYFEVFKNVLFQNQRRLLIIGYGFGDDHINSIISEAVRDHGLKIYVISPDSPKDFRDKLFNKDKLGKDIWKGISGYFPYRLEDIFPKNLPETQTSRNFFDIFFE
jgi:hypothetical protein